MAIKANWIRDREGKPKRYRIGRAKEGICGLKGIGNAVPLSYSVAYVAALIAEAHGHMRAEDVDAA